MSELLKQVGEAVRQRDVLFNALMLVREGIDAGSMPNPLTFARSDLSRKSLRLRPLSVLIDEAVAECGYKLVERPTVEKPRKRKAK